MCNRVAIHNGELNVLHVYESSGSKNKCKQTSDMYIYYLCEFCYTFEYKEFRRVCICKCKFCRYLL